MSFKFKSEDFQSWTAASPQANMAGIAASIANQVLEAHLKTLPRVWKEEDMDDWEEWEHKHAGDSHTALLWGIESIKKEKK